MYEYRCENCTCYCTCNYCASLIAVAVMMVVVTMTAVSYNNRALNDYRTLNDNWSFNDYRSVMQELLSLSDRFGLTVTFQKPDKKLYLDLVDKLADQYQLKTAREELELRAEQFALGKGGRSPRVAKQFVEYIKGTEE